MPGEDEEAAAGSLQMQEVVKSGDGMELVIYSSGGHVVEGEDITAAGDDGEGELAVVVCHEEAAGGGGVAPGLANGAAAEDGFWWKADENLPDDDLIWQAEEERRYSGARHGRRSQEREELCVVTVDFLQG
jgi:hypothetical protein